MLSLFYVVLYLCARVCSFFGRCEIGRNSSWSYGFLEKILFYNIVRIQNIKESSHSLPPIFPVQSSPARSTQLTHFLLFFIQLHSVLRVLQIQYWLTWEKSLLLLFWFHKRKASLVQCLFYSASLTPFHLLFFFSLPLEMDFGWYGYASMCAYEDIMCVSIPGRGAQQFFCRNMLS